MYSLIGLVNNHNQWSWLPLLDSIWVLSQLLKIAAALQDQRINSKKFSARQAKVIPPWLQETQQRGKSVFNVKGFFNFSWVNVNWVLHFYLCSVCKITLFPATLYLTLSYNRLLNSSAETEVGITQRRAWIIIRRKYRVVKWTNDWWGNKLEGNWIHG